MLMANAIITAMVAVSFGSYASSAVADGNGTWTKVFAMLVILAMAGLNLFGSQAVARLQTVIVYVVIGILTLFSVATLVEIDPHLLAFSGYPPLKEIVSSVALTFFAFLGFGVVTFTAKDLRNPSRQLPRAMYLALCTATVIYVFVALGVFGTLTVHQVIESGGTAIAVAAQPVLGRAGYWLMTVTALFATTGATNAGLYPVPGLCEQMASVHQLPALLARRYRGWIPAGLVLTAANAVVLVGVFNLSSIASLGSAIALVVFAMVSAGHIRVRRETGARLSLLALAVGSTVVVFVTFVFTTLVDEPATAWTLVGLLVVSVALDVLWKRAHARPGPVSPAGGTA